MIFHANGDQKKVRIVILISDKIDFKDCYKRQRRTLYNDQGSIQEEDITIIIIYTPNIGATQYIRQMLATIKGEIDSNTIIVGDFNTLLTSMDK